MNKINTSKIFKKKYYLKKITQNYKKLRLSIHKSNKHIEAQVINDEIRKTVAYSGTSDANIGKLRKYLKYPLQKAAYIAGQILGNKLICINVSEVVLDRNTLVFHGCIKNFISGIRSTGVKV